MGVCFVQDIKMYILLFIATCLIDEKLVAAYFDDVCNNDTSTTLSICRASCLSRVKCDVGGNSSRYQMYPKHNCYCDPSCAVLQDCCVGFKPIDTKVTKIPRSLFQCVSLKQIGNMPAIGVSMVTGCNEKWLNEEIKLKCELEVKHDMMLNVHVSEPTHNVVFKNKYCAVCNHVNNFEFWKMKLMCSIEDPTCCDWKLHPPFEDLQLRQCPLDLIESCNKTLVRDIDREVIVNCLSGSYALVYTSDNSVYKNRNCAICNGLKDSDLYCERVPSSVVFPGYSLTMLVDLDSRHLVADYVQASAIPYVNMSCNNMSADVIFNEINVGLSFVTLTVSLVAMAITLIVYIYFSNELLNMPGKILISLIVSLFIAQLMFLIAPSAQDSPDACRAVSVIMHYFFLAAFCWMNIIALDLWTTFSKEYVSAWSGRRRFLKFSIYGWVTPLFIVCVALGLDSADLGDIYNSLKPQYGRCVCWIASRNALIIFFFGPLGVFKLFDIIAFIFTSVYILKAKRQGAMARQKSDVCLFFINIKLSLVMGLTWVFAFLTNIDNVSVFRYLFIALNGLQGLFIAIGFLCTNRVQGLLRSKRGTNSEPKPSSNITLVTPSD